MDKALVILEVNKYKPFDGRPENVEYLVRFPTGHREWVGQRYYDGYMKVIRNTNSMKKRLIDVY